VLTYRVSKTSAKTPRGIELIIVSSACGLVTVTTAVSEFAYKRCSVLCFQGVLREGDEIVLRHSLGIGLRVEVLLQLRRKEMIEPGGLVGTLFSDIDQDDIVDRLFMPANRNPLRSKR
jgi:hypothetical protein